VFVNAKQFFSPDEKPLLRVLITTLHASHPLILLLFPTLRRDFLLPIPRWSPLSIRTSFNPTFVSSAPFSPEAGMDVCDLWLGQRWFLILNLFPSSPAGDVFVSMPRDGFPLLTDPPSKGRFFSPFVFTEHFWTRIRPTLPGFGVFLGVFFPKEN